MRKLNLTFRGKNKSTDVLSFPQMNWKKPLKIARHRVNSKTKSKAKKTPSPLGDIVISLADAKRNATAIGHGLDRETAFLLVHGILHLCGHDHLTKAEEKTMTTQQKILMNCFAKSPSVKSPIWQRCVVAKNRAR